jgi:protein-S-isoprenylcysteine O-methyltransferase
MFNPTVVDASSFVVNHSKPYTIAMLVALFEFCIRFMLFPSFNSYSAAFLGIILVSMGQLVRSMAMITCGESFNHIIQQSKKDSHKIVTNGIYMYLRHPSYTGFFYWSVGTQLLLGNFVTSFLFAAASWHFFSRRIPFEEQTLLKLFPKEYPSYMERTKVGIPFIK